MTMRIKKASKQDFGKAIKIAKELKEWFTEGAVKNMEVDFKVNNLLIAVEKNVRGFLCYSSEHGMVKIIWMGVSKKEQRKSMGEKLIERLIKEAKNLKSKKLIVETLPDEDDYEHYKLTRNFYYKMGFKRIAYIKAVREGFDDQILLEKEI